MKTSLLPLAGLLPVCLVAPLSAQSAGPVTVVSGSATWTEQALPFGTHTTFTINGNSTLEWASGFNLTPGSDIYFNFVGGNSVVNLLGGTGVNIIGGNVSSNGNVSFVSPTADLVVSGNVSANSVTLSTLGADPAALLGNTGKITFSGDPASSTSLVVNGSIESRGGDIILVGQRVVTGDRAALKAKGSVLMAGGSRVELDRSASARTIKSASSDGFVFHLGKASAGRIEVAAGADCLVKGQLKAGKIFLEVGNSGKILKEASGLLVSPHVEVNGTVQKGGKYGADDADSASSLNPSTLKMPTIRRPDGTTLTKERTVVSNVPVSANADTARDRKSTANAAVASRDRSDKQPLMQRGSFFGMRGGSETVKAEKTDKADKSDKSNKADKAR